MQTKKKDGGKNSESYILYQTLRDMNLSKFVAQDVPLFLSLLSDLFPALDAPPDSTYPSVEANIAKVVEKNGHINFLLGGRKSCPVVRDNPSSTWNHVGRAIRGR